MVPNSLPSFLIHISRLKSLWAFTLLLLIKAAHSYSALSSLGYINFIIHLALGMGTFICAANILQEIRVYCGGSFITTKRVIKLMI